MKRTDGTSFWANISSTVVKNSDKTMTLNSVLSDISRRKRMEEELREQERVMMIETRQNASRDINDVSTPMATTSFYYRDGDR